MRNRDILVIEDNELNRKLVRALLQKDNYNAIEAEDAEAGIQLAREHEPGLILMDIQLPGMDGLTATRIIKQDLELREIPVVALTAHAMEGDKEKAMEAGCAGYISKPFNIKEFLEEIKRFFPDGHEGKAKRKNRGGRKRILVVDDDPLNAKLISAKLPQEEYQVFTAYNGPEALNKLAEECIDLILLDIMMPGMDGYEVTRRVRRDPVTSEIPIIFLTALEGAEETLKGLEAGAEEFLNKPVSTVELLYRIESLIRFKECREQCTIHAQSEAAIKTGIPRQQSADETTTIPSILLVEDNPKEAQMIRQCLNGPSFKIDTVKDGEEALSRVEKNGIDLILLDILLPGINGFEVCRQLKSRALTRNIQIVVITCLSDLEDKIRGLEIGADEFLVKPIKAQELRIRVQTLLRKKMYIDRLNGYYELALKEAIIDKMTGLYNRVYFSHFCELEIKRSRRQKYPLSLLMIHMDDFEEWSGALEHLTGESILKEFGQLIKSNFREVDLAARYEGERYVILLPYTDGARAVQIAQRVAQVLHSHFFLQGTAWPSLRLSISMGAAEFSENHPDIEEWIQKAEEALYKGKKESKNRVYTHEASQEIAGS